MFFFIYIVLPLPFLQGVNFDLPRLFYTEHSGLNLAFMLQLSLSMKFMFPVLIRSHAMFSRKVHIIGKE